MWRQYFSRREYQSNSGNQAHARISLAVYWEKLSEEESVFVKKLGWDSVFGVIRSDDIEDFIAKGIISIKDEVDNNFESSITFLTQKCNGRCMVKNQLENWYSVRLIIVRWPVIIKNKCLWIPLW